MSRRWPMLHRKRTWCVTSVEIADELAEKLIEYTWTSCTAFEHRGYLFLNDSTGPDGAQEYAILRKNDDGTWLQIESITFSWCNSEKARDYIRRIVAGEFDLVDYAALVYPKLETPAQHRQCPNCA